MFGKEDNAKYLWVFCVPLPKKSLPSLNFKQQYNSTLSIVVVTLVDGVQLLV
jgi:hypothetical protein